MQGIALRSHQDDRVDIHDTSGRHRNFQALLHFRIDACNESLKRNLETTGWNALYISKETQNDMIVICGELIRRKITKKIQEAGLFSVIADE